MEWNGLGKQKNVLLLRIGLNICLDTNKFVLLSFFSLIKTINPRVSTKPLPNDALPVDVRRSKTPLLKLPNNCKVRSATPNYDLALILDTL